MKDFDAVRRRLEAKKDFITCQECDEKVPLIDFIEQRLKSDPVARKILEMDETATRELDTQALEQILIGHMMAIAGEANQIFRSLSMFDHGSPERGRRETWERVLRLVCVEKKLHEWRLSTNFYAR